MTAQALLACDWGSTNLRAWVLDANGAVLAGRTFPLGVNGLEPGQAAVRFRDEVRPALGAQALPALLCGAVGSNVGWTTVPYVDCPAGLDDVARALHPVEEGVFIAPGLRCAGLEGISDVLRGEETQAFGWVAADPSRARGRRLLCLPGTHVKWIEMEDGRARRFVSAFTGEVFALLRRHSILRGPEPPSDDPAFAQGLRAAGEGDALLNRLYAARSRVAGDAADPATTGSFVSGLLIGADVAASPRLLGMEGQPVTLLGDPNLCALYAVALARRGTPCEAADGDRAVQGGLGALAKLGGLL